MNQLTRFACVLVGIGALGLTACGGDDDSQTGIPDAGGNNGSGSYTHYVSSSLKFGTTPPEATGYAIVDLSEKTPRADPQNSLGLLLAQLNPMLMIDAALGTAVTSGQIVILYSLRSDDATLTTDPTATWQVWLGAPQANPKLDGTGTFTVATNAPTDALLSGTISAGKFSGTAAKVTLELALFAGSAPLRIDLVAPHLEATVSPTGCMSGRLQGAITEMDIHDDVAPFLATYLDSRIAADAGCREALVDCEEVNRTLLGLFDRDSNRVISAAEVQVAAPTILPKDVDVLAANGQPGHDMVDDSVSVALGFSCAKGTYDAPTE